MFRSHANIDEVECLLRVIQRPKYMKLLENWSLFVMVGVVLCRQYVNYVPTIFSRTLAMRKRSQIMILGGCLEHSVRTYLLFFWVVQT